MKLISVLTIGGLKKEELALLSDVGDSKVIYSAPGEIAKDQFYIGTPEEIHFDKFFYIGEDVKGHEEAVARCVKFYNLYKFEPIAAVKKKAKAKA